MSTLRKIFKLLAKMAFGIFLTVFLIALTIHIPFIQDYIGSKTADYLTRTTGGTVSIGQLRFGLNGKVSLQNLSVCDPKDQCYLDLGYLETNLNVKDLLDGTIHFESIALRDTKMSMATAAGTTSLDYIIRAFSSSPRNSTDSTHKQTAFQISADDLNLHDISFHLYDSVANLMLDSKISEFSSSGIIVTQTKIIVREANLLSSGWDILQTDGTNEESPQPETLEKVGEIQELFGDLFFDISFDVGQLRIEDTNFSYHVNTRQKSANFDIEHIDLTNIGFLVSNFIWEEELLDAKVSGMHFKTGRVPIKEMGFLLHEVDSEASLNDLHIQTANSLIRVNLTTDFSDVYHLIEGLDSAQTVISLDLQLSQDDIEYFADTLLSDEIKYPRAWKIRSNLAGNPHQLHVRSLAVEFNNNQVSTSGKLQEWLSDTLSWKGVSFAASVDPTDPVFESFLVPEFRLKEQISLEGRSEGDLRSLSYTIHASSVSFDATSSGFLGIGKESFGFNSDLNIGRLNFDRLTGQKLSNHLTLKSTVEGEIGAKTNIHSTGTITSLSLFERNLRKISYTGWLQDDLSSIQLSIEDENIAGQLDAQLKIGDTLHIASTIKMDSLKASLMTYPANEYAISFESQIDETFTPDFKYLNGELEISKLHLYNGKDKFVIDSISLKNSISKDTTGVSLTSSDFSGEYNSNFDLPTMGLLLRDYLKTYSTDDNHPASFNGKTAKWYIELARINNLQLPGFSIDTIGHFNISGGINDRKKAVYVDLLARNIQFEGLQGDSIRIKLEDSFDQLDAEASISNISYNSLEIEDIRLTTQASNDTARSVLRVFDADTTYLHLENSFSGKENSILIHLDSMATYFGQVNFTQEAPMVLTEEELIIPAINIERDGQTLSLSKDQDQLFAEAVNLDLGRLTQGIEYDSMHVVQGLLNGKLSYNFTDTTFNLTTDIDSLKVLETPPVRFIAKASSKDHYTPFDIRFLGLNNKIILSGQLDSRAEQQIEANLNMDVSNLAIFKPFILDRLEYLNGHITSDLKVNGFIEEPDVSGFMAFEGIEFRTSQPNLDLLLPSDTIVFDHRGLSFKDFTVYDQKGHPLTFNGYLRTSNYRDFNYELTANTDRLLLIDNPYEEPYIFQGKLFTGLDLRFSGDTRNTKVDATITIDDSTNLSYITPPEDLELISDKGIVEFVDPEHLTDTSYHIAVHGTAYDSLLANLPGFDLKSRLIIEDGAILKVVVDPRSGDYIEIHSDAAMDFGFDHSGNVRVDGLYTITKGKYELSFYNIVHKTFIIEPGSRIAWSGDPEKGDLQITATHTVMASSISLIGHEIGENEKQIYNRALPYKVGINIRGNLESPEVYFTLDLPATERSNYPALDSKLARLSQPEYQSELNKQVFALLVLGGFLPETSGVSEGTVATTALANSVNSILSGQLNKFAGQYVQGVDIDLGMSSYSDFSSGGGQTRTSVNLRVSKSLANDRLTIEAGGSFDVNSNLPGSKSFRGDVAIIYDLTEAGNKKLKAFNNETYDIIYHEVRNTGVALIFIKEFDQKKSETSNPQNQ